MIFTSYFNYKNLSIFTSKMRLVSIARREPNWFTGYVYKPLAPSWDLINVMRVKHNVKEYVNRYYDEVLDKLNPFEVFEHLNNSILLCWEADKNFCHRTLVAGWLNDEIGITIPEVDINIEYGNF